MRFSICIFLCFLVQQISAQDLVLSPIGESLCSPGVSGKSPGKGVLLDYTILPIFKVYPYNTGIEKTEPQTSSSRHINFKLKIPIIHKPNFTMLLGFAHYLEEYDVSRQSNGNISILNAVHDRSLKSTRFSLNMLRPLDEKHYLAFKGDVSFNGDYSGLVRFEERYLKYNIGVLLGIKPHQNFEWGVGLLYRSSFVVATIPVLPFGLYNRTFNDKWGIEAIVPVSIKMRYNINPRSLILFGPEYESRSYSLDKVDAAFSTSLFSQPSEFFMRRSELKFSAAYEHQLTNWIWFNVQAGYSHNLNTRFNEIDINGTALPEVTVDLAGGAFFKVGIFASPPRKKCK